MFESFGYTLWGFVKVAIVLGLAWMVHKKFSEEFESSNGSHYRGQLLLLIMALVVFVLVLVALPINDTLRGQLLSLTGILISAVIALSATTFVGNVMAGAMLRSIKNCTPGDYIEIGEHFGRVTEMDLLHCEIQTQERDLITLPNMYMVTNPMRLLRTSGTRIYATLSLGYDVSRKRVEQQLIEAANETGLEQPMVLIKELGDFSITYQVSGLLKDLRSLLSMRSKLHAKVLDQLHQADIEIVSPTFMNQRQFDNATSFVPDDRHRPMTETVVISDDVVFDKAAKASSLRDLKTNLEDTLLRIKELEKKIKEASDEKVIAALNERMERRKVQAERWRQVIESREKRLDSED